MTSLRVWLSTIILMQLRSDCQSSLLPSTGLTRVLLLGPWLELAGAGVGSVAAMGGGGGSWLELAGVGVGVAAVCVGGVCVWVELVAVSLSLGWWGVRELCCLRWWVL